MLGHTSSSCGANLVVNIIRLIGKANPLIAVISWISIPDSGPVCLPGKTGF